jgi:ADP-heptose:LPS heptosyltransferase
VSAKTPGRWTWKPYQPIPAKVYLTPSEDELGHKHAGKILIEPNTKNIGHNNKAWLWDRWQELSYRFPSRFVQVGWGDTRRLKDVEFVPTHNVRLAVAVMKHSIAYVGPEGGLHHAAAAVGTPAVVLFGGFISPDITGYGHHRNIFTGGTACGMRSDCAHCRQAMAAITVDMVERELRGAL